MKLLARIEKQKISWVLILLCLIFFLFRLPSLVEPYWYGDEGIYEVIGQSINQGHLLYRDIWDNKPPLLYMVYALVQGDQPAVKLVSLLTGILTTIAFFFLVQKLFNKQKLSIITTSLFVLLFATPILEANIANAENFILLPIILAGLIIYQYTTHAKSLTANARPLLVAGLLLGIAFLFKIVAVFDLVAFLCFLSITYLPDKFSWKSIKKQFNTAVIRNISFLLLGFLVPFLITIIYFGTNNALPVFLQSTFAGNVDYVGWKNSLFGIPQGLLLVKTVLLLSGIVIIIKGRKRFSSPVLFILLWTLFSLFNVYFSGRSYTHYSLVFLPGFCLFFGLPFISQQAKVRAITIGAIILLVFALHHEFNFNLGRSYAYYQNAIAFMSGQKSVESYRSFFDQKVPRDYTVAAFIDTHTTDQDTVFIWGNNPQIYAMTHKLPLGKYTVAYHVLQNNGYDETQLALNKGKPKYIIVLKETQPLPFVIPLYIMRYNIAGATIYERSL